MTTKSALDILPALVNSPFCYKLGVSAIKDYKTQGRCRSLHQAPAQPGYFILDFAKNREPAETDVEKKIMRISVKSLNCLSHAY